MNQKVFISYASEDEEFTEKVFAGLKAFGLDAWFAPSHSRAGDFLEPIDQQLDLRDVYVPVWTPRYFEPGYAQYEWKGIKAGYAIGGKRVIPIILQECTNLIPPSLRTCLNVDAMKMDHDGLISKLVSLIADGTGTPTAKDLWPPRAFILEDRRTIRKLLAMELAEFEYTVIAATTIGEATSKLAQLRHCDLVILDLHIEGEIRGWKIADVCNERFPESKRFILSGHSDEITRLKAMSPLKLWEFVQKSARGAHYVRTEARKLFKTIEAHRKPLESGPEEKQT